MRFGTSIAVHPVMTTTNQVTENEGRTNHHRLGPGAQTFVALRFVAAMRFNPRRARLAGGAWTVHGAVLFPHSVSGQWEIR